MVYAPQRRHAIVSLTSTMQTLALMQHMYSPDTIVLFLRVVSHLQIRAPALLYPTRSLLFLFVIVVFANLGAVFMHMLDFGSGQNGSKGLMLDFVGQANPASFTRIFLLDVAIFALQLTTLVVSYVGNYSATLPKSDHFPYDDLLLPPEVRPVVAEADLDVEAGDQFRQRRHGKEPRGPPDSEVWFDEDEEDNPLLGAAPPVRVFTDVSRIRQRRSADPLIFNISPLHLLSLLFRLPNPVPSRLFSGGTPLHTPPATPLPTEQSVRNLVTALAEAQARAEAGAATSVQRLAATRDGQARSDAEARARSGSGSGSGSHRTSDEQSDTDSDDDRDRGSRSSARTGSTPQLAEGSQRIPGDYWTTRATG